MMLKEVHILCGIDEDVLFLPNKPGKKRMNLIFALKTLIGSCCMLLSYELWVSLPMKLGTGEIKRKRRWVLPGVS